MMKIPLRRPSNDNGPALSATFDGFTDLFLSTYSADLLAFADRLGRVAPEVEPTCAIDLWSPPEATILSTSFQGTVTIRCDVMIWNTMELTFHLRPIDEDRDRVARHCEVLPAILAAYRAKNAARAGLKRKVVDWSFAGSIPNYFLQRYGYELREWARNFAAIGPSKTIVLREGTLSDLSPDPEQGAELLGVVLKATVEKIEGERIRIAVAPETENDERKIRQHVEKMTAANLSPTIQLVEPPRPGLPFMPTIAGAPARGEGDGI